MRAESSAAPLAAFPAFISPRARWIASAARTARSASFSCARGYPKTAMSPSPSILSTWPPSAVTALEASSRYALTRLRQSSASSFVARLVDPARSQNIIVIGRRSASAPDVGGDGDCWADVGFAADGGVPPAERAAIARMSRLRCPSGTPIFSRSASTRSGRTFASISCSRNRASYCPRSIAFSHWATFIVVPARFNSDDGPRETASPGRERWPAAMGSIRRVRDAAGECLLFPCAVRRRRFPVGASPTRRTLQPEATGAVMEVTKWLKPSV